MEPHFFQLLDRIRFQAALSAIAREGKSLALISQVQALTDHYKEALLDRLQHDAPGLAVKAFFPADSDSIVQSFNQIVGQMPIAQALETQAAGQNLNLWVVHDAAALPAHELRLLLELLEKFPGSRVRALLVYGGVETLPEGLTDFEKSLMRWIVDRPNFEHIKEALAQEQDPERAVSLRALIQRMVPGGGNKDAVTAALNSHAAQTARVQKSPPAQKAQWSRWLKIGLIAASAMALSIAVAFRLHSDLFDAVFPNRLFVFESEKKPMPDEPKPDLKLPASTDKETPGVSANPLNDASKTVNGTSLKGPEFLITEPEKLITELPEEALKGEQWAWQLSVSSIIIQHGIAPTFAKALDLRQRYPDLSQVRVVPQFVGNESQARFALVSGPYLSKEEAEQYLKSNKTPKDSWVRGVGALQERLLPKSPDAKKP